MAVNGTLSVTIRDCVVQTFRSGGNGGQNQNKRDTGVRVIHEPSGAIGESREFRTQLENKRSAFRRMAEHPRMTTWINRTLYGEDRAKREVETMMQRTGDFRIEGKVNGKWQEMP